MILPTLTGFGKQLDLSIFRLYQQLSLSPSLTGVTGSLWLKKSKLDIQYSIFNILPRVANILRISNMEVLFSLRPSPHIPAIVIRRVCCTTIFPDNPAKKSFT